MAKIYWWIELSDPNLSEFRSKHRCIHSLGPYEGQSIECFGEKQTYLETMNSVGRKETIEWEYSCLSQSSQEEQLRI